MIEIKEKDSKMMWVWKDENHKFKRKVVAKYNYAYLAFGEITRLKELFLWPYAEPVIIESSAVIRGVEEITGVPESIAFSIYTKEDIIEYTSEMNKLAGQRIIIVTPSDPENCKSYDYAGGGFVWLKGWLKDFKEEEK